MTESRYFNEIKRRFPGVSLTVLARGKDPDDLVARARALRDDDERQARDCDDEDNRLDRVYVVTDVDDFGPQLVRLRNDPRALEGIELVISNPCFEVWLVCHKTRPDRDRRRVQQQAKELGLVTGPNSKEPVLSALTDVDKAERMAQHLRDCHRRDGVRFPDDVPSTSVDTVVAYLREAGAGLR